MAALAAPGDTSDVKPQSASIYESDDWWSGSVRGLRQLRKLVPARFTYLDRVLTDWSGLRVLDLGCGGGFMAEALAHRGAVVTGIDSCAQAVAAATRHARAEGLNLRYGVARGEALPLGDASVDVVVCVDVLEHVERLDEVLVEMRRVLVPGGLLVFDTINRTALASFVLVTMAERVLRLLPRGTHDPRLFITPRELSGRLVALGFVVEPFVGLGPVGLDRDFDFLFGLLPTLAILFMGQARSALPAQGNASPTSPATDAKRSIRHPGELAPAMRVSPRQA